jgi:hypothetical protein
MKFNTAARYQAMAHIVIPFRCSAAPRDIAGEEIDTGGFEPARSGHDSRRVSRFGEDVPERAEFRKQRNFPGIGPLRFDRASEGRRTEDLETGPAIQRVGFNSEPERQFDLDRRSGEVSLGLRGAGKLEIFREPHTTFHSNSKALTEQRLMKIEKKNKEKNSHFPKNRQPGKQLHQTRISFDCVLVRSAVEVLPESYSLGSVYAGVSGKQITDNTCDSNVDTSLTSEQLGGHQRGSNRSVRSAREYSAEAHAGQERYRQGEKITQGISQGCADEEEGRHFTPFETEAQRHRGE